ncbi:hypothetical protein B484DRAFT_448738 [Ochromonadaceae sp. CCMP2298]|nr:hypothetical protein B484DRAFT_448738 [Ochromonadaceae sp. CCMP2298]
MYICIRMCLFVCRCHCCGSFPPKEHPIIHTIIYIKLNTKTNYLQCSVPASLHICIPVPTRIGLCTCIPKPARRSLTFHSLLLL